MEEKIQDNFPPTNTHPIFLPTTTSTPSGVDISSPHNTTAPPSLVAAPWVVPLLAAAATTAAAIIAFEIYVIVRATQHAPSRRHLLLGQCLLVGLLLASLSALPITLHPTPFTCAATRLLAGVSSALVFGTLLVKCVFLISLNSGVYLPAHYQALLLFFIVLVQVSINTQWQWWEPAGVGVVREGEGGVPGSLTCLAPYRHLLLSLLYVIILIVVVATMAIKCRGIRENYREVMYIGGAVGVVVPIWLVWMLTGLILPHHLHHACLGFGLIATATVVFVIMFIPKGRQMAAFGKDGMYREDREDITSTLTSVDGRYSPSFFLFKPVKASKEFPAPTIQSLYKTRIRGNRREGAYFRTPLPQLPHAYHWPPSHYHNYHNYHYLQGLSRCEEGVYTTIEPSPTPHHTHHHHHHPPPPPSRYPLPSNPNFYLFRSHTHAGMMY